MSYQDSAPARVSYVPTYEVQRLLDDLDSLADSWNSLAVTYRLGPSGFWARLADHDYTDRADVLESAATQLLLAMARFQERSGT